MLPPILNPIGAISAGIGAGIGAIGAQSGISAIGASVQNVGEAAQSVAQGVGSVVSNAYGAGVAVGEAILDGLLSELGPSGQAIAQMAGTFARTVGTALTDSLSTIGDLANKAGRGVGAVGTAGAGALGGVAGAGIGAALGPVGIIGGGALGIVVGTFVGLLASKLIAAVGEIIGGILSAAGKAIGAAGELIASGLRGVLTIVKDLASTTEKWGSAVATIQAQIGGSVRDAATLSSRFGAVGLRGALGSVTHDIGNQPQLYGMRARAFGLGGYDSAGFVPQLAQRFQGLQQGGLFGQMRARAMTSALGFDSPESLRVLSINPQRLREQQQEVGGFARDLGLNPQRLKEAADGVFLFQNKIQSLVEILKLKILDTAISYIGPRIEKLTQYLTAHADSIGAFVERGLKFLFEDVPPAFLRFGAAAATGLGNFLIVTGEFLTGLQANLPAMTDFANRFLGGLHEFVANLAGVAGAIGQMAKNAFEFLKNLGVGGSSSVVAASATGATVAPTTGAVSPTGGVGAAPSATPPPSSGLSIDELLNAGRSAKKKPFIQSGFELPTVENDGSGGRLTGTLLGAVSGFMSGARAGAMTGSGRATLIGAGVGTVTGGIAGYKLGAEYDAGGERRAKLQAQGVGAVSGGVSAAVASKGNPYYTAAGAAVGAIAGGRIYEGAAPTVRNVAGVIGKVGDGLSATFNGTGVGGVGAIEAFNQSKANFKSSVPRWKIPDEWGASDGPVGSRLGAGAEMATSAGKALLERGQQLGGAADGWQKMMLSRLEAIERNTGQGANETRKVGEYMGGFTEAVSHRTAGVINDEVSRNLSWST